MRLYDVSESILAILGEEDAELTPEAEAALSSLQMEFSDVAQAILKYRQGLDADVAELAFESIRLQLKADALAKKAEWLKGYVLAQMQRLKIGKLSGIVTATVCKSPPSVKAEELNLNDEALNGFVRTIPEKKELDKKAVLEAWKANKPLPIGLSVVDNNTHLKVS